MAWKKVGGAITKWEAGMVVEGTFIGTKPGKFNELAMIREDSGESKTYPMPALLASIFAAIKPGAMVRITCRGLEKMANGKDSWGFDVEQDDAIEFDPAEFKTTN